MKLRDWSLRRWVLLIASVILLASISLRLHLKWRVRDAVRELQAAGRPTRYAELLQRQGASEGAANMVTSLTNAIHRLPELDATTRDRLPVVGMTTLPATGRIWPEEMRTVTRDYLEANRGVLREIHAALTITNAWWWNSYNPEQWGISGLSKAKGAAAQLSLEAAFLAQGGDLDGAMNSTSAIFTIGERMYDDPILITHLVRIAVQAIGLSRLEYVLGSGTPTHKSIRLTMAVLRRQLSQVSLSHVYEGEEVFFLEPAYHRSQRMLFGETAAIGIAPEAGTWEDYRQFAMELAYRMSGLADQDILYAIKANTEIASLSATLAGQLELKLNGSTFLPSKRGLRFHYWSEAALTMSGGKFLQRPIENHARLRAADAALAVTQYRLQHGGQLPTSLDVLVPEFLEAVPIDPQSGKPFELIVTPDGYGIGRGTPVFTVKLNPQSRERA